MPSPLKLMTIRAFNAFTLKGVVISEREKPGQVYQKEDNVPKGLPKEATVLGTIQILCFLVISSLGVILVSAPNSSQLSPAISTILTSGFPFLGALCFAITGTLSIISGKNQVSLLDSADKAVRLQGQEIRRQGNHAPQQPVSHCEVKTERSATNSLISSAVSSVAAGVGLVLLANSPAAPRPASQQCDSGRDYRASLPYARYHYSIYEVKDCLLTSVGLTGVLVVMLTFTVLELSAAAYASVFWWKRSTLALHSSGHK
ncbi:unnamed protein product [Rangifer tarandus platyrhynchus]|uniref:Membrane-spanning 4-domains subfamily A member 7 n=3 Tax=Rangifer tarandus platyrhynchus TaxID=3082113 RepID=A0ABN8XZH4_RANTA|nr:unnamed protein product [Rangifer tarandus platyrhynchus]CAI9692544.1 unnamed protein product [Rangifer tarandus platyrhynchus]